jgi:hypothetical protein
MNILILKNKYFTEIRSHNFSSNTLHQYLDGVISKYSTSPDQNILQTLYNYKNSIDQICMYQNTNDKFRFFMNIESSLVNLYDENVWIDLLSFFDDSFMYTQHIRELTNLTSRNEILIQESLNLNEQLNNAIHKIENLGKRLEHLININLSQNDELLIIRENTTNTNNIVENIDANL